MVVFTYDAFTGTGSRTGTLTIAGQTVTVTQAGAGYIGPYGSSPITLVSSGLDQPYGVAVDSAGNVYLADTFNQAIEEWAASTQQMTTLVSSGLNYPGGVGVDGSGNVYIADSGNWVIKEWAVSTQRVSTLVPSGLWSPYSLAVDCFGNVYIADTNDQAIKEWNASTQQVTTLVSSGLSNPHGMAVDVSGNLYATGEPGHSLAEWNASTQQLTTLASAGLASPFGTAVDGSGNVFVTDTANSAIYEWSATTQGVFAVASAGLNAPYGVALDGSGNMYIADTGNSALKELPYAFVGPARFTEPAYAGTDSLLPVLPATASLTGVYAPTSDSSWLTIGTIANGVVGFSFTANTSGAARVGHISILGQQIAVTQNNAPATPPQAVSVAPASGSGLAQTFTFQYSDSAGATDLSAVQVWFAVAGSSGSNSCLAEYYRPANTLYLLNDAGAAWTAAVVGSGGSLSNSQCSINAATTSVSLSGAGLTLALPVTFASTYSGAKNVYSLAIGSTANSGWQIVGAWTVPLSGVAVVDAISVAPASGSGLAQTFTFQYSDSAGATDLSAVQVWFAVAGSSGINSCLAEYYRPANTLYLLNDAGAAWTAAIVGSGGTLSNSQCSINAATASASISGTGLTLALPVTFASTYSGAKNVYSLAIGSTANSGWQIVGAWTP